ncbi:MAG TPA: hypothetical protein DCG75_16970 [Bacteroidales bacterium]|jgi:hypothetical protein|nr:hypothetical protein [Bacteroidales bacterium]
MVVLLQKKQLEMRKIVLLVFCLLFFKLSYSLSPGESNNSLLLITQNNTELTLNKNYQQFKYQVVNLETNDYVNYANLARRRKKNDNLMLYVAGGLALATATLILTNNPENFTSNSASGVNLGIAVGGTVACGMIVAKYFIDKRR